MRKQGSTTHQSNTTNLPLLACAESLSLLVVCLLARRWPLPSKVRMRTTFSPPEASAEQT